MNEVKVSIIVPVYNVEKYLTVCMESLIHQTLEDIEIIVVNDGSPDNSIKILEGYEKEYPAKVRVFTTENRGVSHARNYGLDRAVGEYIMFVDSDDFIELDMAEKLYTKASADNNDLVMCARYNVYEVPGKEELQKKEMKVFYMNQNYRMSERKFELVHASPFPWDKLFKRSLLKEIRFPEGLRFEDLVVAFEAMTIAESIGVVPEPLYNYRKTTQVGFLNSFSEATKDIVEAFGLVFRFMREHKLYDIFKEELEYVCVRHFFYRYESFYSDEKKGQLPLKIDIINATQDFLEREIPEWPVNHYLKYTASSSLKKHLKHYVDRKKTIRYVTLRDRLPGRLLRILVRVKDKWDSFQKKWRKFKKSRKKLTFIKNRFKKSKLYKLYHLPADVRYTKYYEKLSVDEKVILFESKHGEDLAGNIFNMIYECKRGKYRGYHIYLVLQKELFDTYEELLYNYGINYVSFIEIHTDEYLKALASAKYLVTDTSFPPYYIKKPEQVYLNTWHGTPLKAMGRIVQDREYGLGNVQRNFYIADYLLYQNEFSKNVFFEDYMLEEAYKGKVLLSGYPRNSSFYRAERRDQIRRECFLTDKQVIVYMPTWRGLLHKKQNKEQVTKIFNYLAYLDRKLKPNQVLYVKLHPFVKNEINYRELLHVKEFPSAYESYDFLNASDMLITDYSSIMFDYAVSGKKIILFTYDREEYLGDRGIYISLDEMDLPKVDTVKELVEEINKEEYGYPKFHERFCSLDSAECARNVCDTMFLGEETGLLTEDYSENKKTNTLIYLRNLRDTKENLDFIKGLNKHKDKNSHIYLNFKAGALKKNSRNLSLLHKNIGYIPLSVGRDNTFLEYIAFVMTFRFGIETKSTRKRLAVLAKRENLKNYGNIKFDTVINYSGMDLFLLHQFEFLADRRVYCFSDFDESKYYKDKKYRKNIEYALKHLGNYTTVVIPSSMKKLKSMEELMKKVNVVVSEESSIHLEMLLKEAK
ncbi:CDP-glycerol glycerophosphotransferase family protein [Anaerocolumna xylanovorans]|uniref:CDP-glycerol glycerophosphotransferase, TagB/SpsB family n=1 Tax=Anaerocolumna xylanovorans DSM 12503 TaxID=1121345 RepID=A0A1M7Y4H0_9FIRM|nr:CDP-glycerol glycerophosphotransferase family protein [Anaerocolumna xylanovorans]SHO47131.1 CDP-glycerol glycerophosphotransferase, TagB/SpsB family [Anaerocolumna xylanovorans DSM 12503]